MMESYRAAVHARQQSALTTSEQPKDVVKPVNENQTATIKSGTPTINNNMAGSVVETRADLPTKSEPMMSDDKENSPPPKQIKDDISTQNILCTKSDISEGQDGNKSQLNPADCGSLPTCGKCTKRRRAVDYDDSDSDNVFLEDTPPKKAKSSPPKDTNKNNQLEPMQTDSHQQISNLVNIFNTGFSGLVKVQATADSLKNSCSNALKNSFDNLARPIIAVAMTV